MKKLFTRLFLLGAMLTVGAAAASAEEGTTPAVVKMTYVNYDEPDKSYGEIAAGEIAKAGYNNISNGTVGFVNTGWNCNWITYLQVDASAIEGVITKATLTFDASGSTDNKRTTTWGAGYNSSEWSSEMTYNTANRSITTVGITASTTSKSASTFATLSIDITDAVKAYDSKIVTVLIYETAAAGGYIKNPKVSVEWTTATPHHVTFTETNGVKPTITLDGSNVTAGTNLVDGTYSYTATATGYFNYTGTFTVAGEDLNVEFTMTPKATWSYTVEALDQDGNSLGTVNSGTGYEGDNVQYNYPEFYLDKTTLMSKARNSSNPYFGGTAVLDADNKIFQVTYNGAEVSDVVFYKEAENMEGFTSRNTNNAPVRCSNGLGGTANADEVLLTTLPAGKYTIFGQVWGTTGLTAGVKIKAASTQTEEPSEDEVATTAEGDEEEPVEPAADTILWELASTGSLTSSTSDEFELQEETPLYVYTTGGSDKRMLDLIYIKKTGDVETGIENIAEEAASTTVYSINGMKMGDTLQGLNAGIYIVRQGAKVSKIIVK